MNSNIQYLSTTKIAKIHNIQASPDLFDYLIYLQLLIKVNKEYQLTKTGVELGGIYQSNHKNESWIAWKDGCLDTIISDLKASANYKKIKNHEILVIDNVEVKYNYKNDNFILEDDDLVYIIVCTIKNEKNIYYELTQQIINSDITDKLVEKIKNKGIIDPRYWCSKEMENYNNYFSDGCEGVADDYYNETEDDDPCAVNGKIYLGDRVWIDKKDVWF